MSEEKQLAATTTTTTTNGPAAPKDKSGSFYRFQQLCISVSKEGSLTTKTSLIHDYLKTYQGICDPYLICKFLLARTEHRVYHLKEKAIAKILSRVLNQAKEEAAFIADVTTGGDIGETTKKMFRQYGKPEKWSTLTMKEVDDWLEELSKMSKEDEQVEHFNKLFVRRGITVEDSKTIANLIKRDIGVGVGPKVVLDALDKDAYEAYKNSNDLKRVVDKVMSGAFNQQQQQKSTSTSSTDDSKDVKMTDVSSYSTTTTNDSNVPLIVPPAIKKAFSTGISLQHPIKPMLCKAVKSMEEIITRFPNGFFSEIKYDGERIQIHKDGDKIICYSRTLKPIMEWKVAEVKEFLPKALKDVKQIILDGEILLMDKKLHRPLPFGTLGKHKKENFAEATVCVFVFDILYLNGEVLMNKPITERRKLLEKTLTVIPDRIELSEMKIISEEEELCTMMTRVLREKLEGLVLKELKSIYEPAARHWLKIKKDYIDQGSMADSADLLVLGGYFGKGSNGGIVCTFLMGVYDEKTKRCCTVCKVGSGLDDATLERLQKDLVTKMTKIDRDYSKVPSWLVVNRSLVPDYVIKDPHKTPVWEITGAQFSDSDKHTANGISIRFPRMTHERDDKDFGSSTTLTQLIALTKASTKSLSVKAGGNCSGGSKSKKQKVSESGSSGDDDDEKEDDKISNPSTNIAPSVDPKPVRKPVLKQRQLAFASAKIQKIEGTVLDMLSGSSNGRKIILHIIDDSGRWPTDPESMKIGKAWPKVVEEVESRKPSIGEGLYIKIEAPLASKLYIWLAVARHKLAKGGEAPFQTKPFESSLIALCTFAKHKDATVHFQKPTFEIPKFEWQNVETTLSKFLISKGVTTYIYEEKSSKAENNNNIRGSNNNNNNTAAADYAVDVDTEPDENLAADRKDEKMDVCDQKPFEGLHVLIVDKNESLRQDVISLGGMVIDNWDGSGEVHPTHVICDSYCDIANVASALGATIVKTDWIRDSLKGHFHANESKYSFNNNNNNVDVADMSTEEDEPDSQKQKEEEPRKDGRLVDIFSGCNIFFAEVPREKESLLERYLIAYDGEIDIDFKPGRTTHVIAVGSESNKLHPGIAAVTPQWVWDCINSETLLNPMEYLVK